MRMQMNGARGGVWGPHGKLVCSHCGNDDHWAQVIQDDKGVTARCGVCGVAEVWRKRK